MNVLEVRALAHYFQDTWMNCPFPVPLWNVTEAIIRSSNRVESWHNKLNRTVDVHHPNIFQLVGVLKKEQAAVESTVTRAQRGAEPSARRVS